MKTAALFSAVVLAVSVGYRMGQDRGYAEARAVYL